MRSYLEILSELHKTVDSDIIPAEEKAEIKQKIQELLDMLWKYSA